MLPDGDERSDTLRMLVLHKWQSRERKTHILAVVEENDHSIGVHGLADEELVILEVGNNLLGVTSSTLLESGDLFIGGAVGLHGLLDLLHVALEVGEVRLLVERGLVEAERVDDIDDGLGAVLGLLLGLLSGRVGTNICDGQMC